MRKLSNIIRQELLINGIYKITNIKNGKFYIGSCASKTYMYTRLKHHYRELKLNIHINKYLQNAWNKYGEENFYYNIVEICLPNECIEKEQYWIDLLKPQYNFCKNAGSTLGISPSEKTKKRISDSNKLWYKTSEGIELKKKLSKLRKNGPRYYHTEEHKLYISKILKGRKFSEETLQKMRKPKLNKKKKVIDLDNNIIYNTIEEFAEKFKIRKEYVAALCRKSRYSKKYNIKYLNDGR